MYLVQLFTELQESRVARLSNYANPPWRAQASRFASSLALIRVVQFVDLYS